MQVLSLSTLDELTPYQDDWDRLSAGVPFRSWTWLSGWWRHYGQGSGGGRRSARLFVLAVFDLDQLVGLAPWYLDCGGPWGRVVRLLGSGEVCSDYLSLLCRAGMEDQVAEALADYLCQAGAAQGHDHLRWDLLELRGVDAEDRAIGRLIEHLAERGNAVHRRPAPNCWRIELPAATGGNGFADARPSPWDQYLAMLSRGHRKQLRRLERRMLRTGRAVLKTVEHLDQLPRAIDLLIDLHQRRWGALGRKGCFASRRFTAFHRDVMPELLSDGQLRLHWLELGGKPVAAEYQLAVGGVVYAYQSGMDPDALDEQPGRLITLATLRRAAEQGYRAYDFLRGDEPYKAHFRARPRPSLAVRIVPNRTSAHLRHGLWIASSNIKQWIKGSLKPAGTRES